MDNALEKVKQAAKFIAPSNKEAGVVQTIKSLLL
jgi:hydroxymethylpyrimidine pyrophosphatase-like HAD family hydrolase